MPAPAEPTRRSTSWSPSRGSRLHGSILLAILHLAANAVAASEAYFSLKGGVRQRLLRAVQEARRGIGVAVDDFTAAAWPRPEISGNKMRSQAEKRLRRGRLSGTYEPVERWVEVRQ